jgi:hypothetical protein
MAIQPKIGGVVRTVAGAQVKIAGVWRTVSKVQVKTGGTWRTAFDPTPPPPASLTVTATPSGVSGGGGDLGVPSGTVTSNTTSIGVSGHTGAVTYSWSRISAPDSYSGGFTRINVVAGGQQSKWSANVNDGTHHETWRCTVTDSIGVTGYVDVAVTLTWSNLV